MAEKKYCDRDCIYFESDWHWYGNEEWEEISCGLGNTAIYDTCIYAECEDYDDGGKYDW